MVSDYVTASPSVCPGLLIVGGPMTIHHHPHLRPLYIGVDVVAYFSLDEESEETHINGSSTFTSQLNGYTFWFSSDENQSLFEADPWKYAPMFGGYCSWGMSEEGNNNDHDFASSLLYQKVERHHSFLLSSSILD